MSDIDRVGVKLFLRITGPDGWRLSRHQQATIAQNKDIESWQRSTQKGLDIEVSEQSRIRLSLVAGIQKSIEELYPKQSRFTWPHKGNKDWEGKSLVELVVTKSNGLEIARHWLDSKLNGH